MRRPFAVIGFTFIAALAAASYAGFGISAAVSAFCVVSAAVIFFVFPFLKHGDTIAIVLCTTAAALLAFCFAECLWYIPAEKLDGKTAQIQGVISDEPQQNYGKYYYTVKADKITVNGIDTKVHTKIRISSSYELSAEPFDRISTKAILNLPNARSSSGYNSRSYYKSKGIYLFAAAGKIEVTHENWKPPYYYAILLRQYISNSINKFVGGNEGALADGILIGDTSGLPVTVSSDFSDTGISHILAVSGTQTSLIMQYLMILLAVLHLSRRRSAAVTAVAIILFMAVTGFSPSVMRAGIMSLICLCGIIVKREADVINSLGLSALALCLANPYAATDVGLLLSLTATLGMVLLSSRINKIVIDKTHNLPDRAKSFIRAPLAVLSETLGASLLTYPVIILVFGRVSLISLLSNMIEVPVSLFVTLATAVLAVFAPFSFLVFLIKPIAILIRLCCAFMMWFAHALATLPFATVSAAYGFVNLFLIFAVVLMVLYFVFKGKVAAGAACFVCACFVLSVGIFSYMVASHGVMDVAVTSLKGGTVVTCNGHAVVIGLSTSKTDKNAVENYLKPHNINMIDAVIMTSYDKKQAQTLASLESNMPVMSSYMPANGNSATDMGYAPPKPVNVPTKIYAPYGATVMVLPDSTKQELLAIVDCSGSRVVVTSNGDVGDYSEYNPKALKADLLISGGTIDGYLANAVSPCYALCGLNAKTISLAAAKGANIKNTTGVYKTRGGGYFVSY